MVISRSGVWPCRPIAQRRRRTLLLRLIISAQAANPNVAITHGLLVILEDQRIFLALRGILRKLAVNGGPHQLLVIVQQNAVEEHGRIGGLYQLAVSEYRRLEYDVVALPFAGLASCICKRRPLSIERAGLAIGVGRILVGIENLNFVQALQEYAAIAAILAVATNFHRRSPLNVQLHIAKLLLGGEVASTRRHFQDTVGKFPIPLAARLPLRKIFAIEEDYGIGRCA